MNRRARWKEYLFRGVLLSSSVLACILAGELAMRSYAKLVEDVDFFEDVLTWDRDLPMFRYTERGRRLKPDSHFILKNHRLSGRDIEIRTNSLGFRDDEILPKRPGEFRILFLGDSITWGDYLPREEVYVERLEARLNGASRGTRYQVINAGMGDLGMAEEVGVLRELGLKTDPDLVGVGFYLNDSRAPWGAYVEKGALYRLLKRSRFLNWVYRRVWVQAYVMKHGKERFPRIDLYESGRWRHDEASYRELVESAGNDWGAGWDPRSWRIIDWQLDRLLELEKKHGFRLFLVCFPVRVQVESSIFDDTPQRALEEFCRRKGIPFLDLMPVLRARRELDLFYDHCHLKPMANTLVASEIHAFLAREGLLPR